MILRYNEEEKQRQSMETPQLSVRVPSLLQPGKITSSGVTQCSAQSEG